MIIAVVPLLLAIVFALVYALAANPKIVQLALYGWLAAMVALCVALATHTVRLF